MQWLWSIDQANDEMVDYLGTAFYERRYVGLGLRLLNEMPCIYLPHTSTLDLARCSPVRATKRQLTLIMSTDAKEFIITSEWFWGHSWNN